MDEPPAFGYFGEVETDVQPTYSRNDTVTVVFWGANPRNDYRTQDTFLTVEKYDSDWQVVLTDGDFETQFHWQRYGIAASLITIVWNIPSDAPTGVYRIQTFGTSKDLFGYFTPYNGTSSTFKVQ